MTLQEWIDAYNEFDRKNSDPRTKGWFLVDSPVLSLVLCLSYVVIVKVIGPRFMKNREPYNLQNIMLIYNLTMVIVSAYMVYLFGTGGWFTTYTIGCLPVDKSTSPEAMKVVWGSYLFYVSKYVEFLDTIFFVLRKKFHLVTFLHVWHHGVMPWSWITAPKYTPGGMCSFAAMLNSGVHVLMYSYYFIAALGPEYKKYIWWKKYLTRIQMVQFIAIIVHASQSFFIECDFPAWVNYWLILFSGIFLILFLNYYFHEHQKRRQQTSKTSSTSRNEHNITNGVRESGKDDKKRD